MDMRFLIFITLCCILLVKFQRHQSATWYAVEHAYIKNVENLTTIDELENFFEAQSAIYVDNAFSLLQKFFYKLLGDLPRSQRSKQVQEVILEMDRFLEVELVEEKMQIFDDFILQYETILKNVFEFDAEETLLSSNDFNDIFAQNDVDAVLTYVNHDQLHKYVEFAGNGIKAFLLYNRSLIDTEKMLIFKSIVDKFLEQEEFLDKRESLREFIDTSKQLLPNRYHKIALDFQ